VPEVLVAFGGNVGDARKTIASAIEVFCDGDEVSLLRRSADYKTPPWGVTEQPPFINVCVAVSSELIPHALLERAQAVERLYGRDRKNEQRWGPRTLDIDLIAYDDLAVDEPDLVLPHPRLFERAFVLVPLADIAPDRVIAGQRIADAAARADRTGIERLSD
jgi:2-amino-4-hydroxy-6-hydroxymethyldihydropteridine diphosphokinase